MDGVGACTQNRRSSTEPPAPDLWAARERWQQLKPGEDPLKWSDMMILVRSRTHLRAYEAGLRALHIPFTSSRAGGLLDALEVDDLVALLRWMTMPADDLSLAVDDRFQLLDFDGLDQRGLRLAVFLGRQVDQVLGPVGIVGDELLGPPSGTADPRLECARS